MNINIQDKNKYNIHKMLKMKGIGLDYVRLFKKHLRKFHRMKVCHISTGKEQIYLFLYASSDETIKPKLYPK